MFGLGKGDMKIILDKNQFIAGETIRGKVLMTLKKPQAAKQVRIILLAEKKRNNTVSYGNDYRTETSVEIIYKQQISLDGEKEYAVTTYEYPFEFVLPNPLPYPTSGWKSFLSGPKPTWYLDAALDIPNSLDVSKKQKIKVTA